MAKPIEKTLEKKNSRDKKAEIPFTTLGLQEWAKLHGLPPKGHFYFCKDPKDPRVTYRLYPTGVTRFYCRPQNKLVKTPTGGEVPTGRTWHPLKKDITPEEARKEVSDVFNGNYLAELIVKEAQHKASRAIAEQEELMASCPTFKQLHEGIPAGESEVWPEGLTECWIKFKNAGTMKQKSINTYGAAARRVLGEHWNSRINSISNDTLKLLFDEFQEAINPRTRKPYSDSYKINAIKALQRIYAHARQKKCPGVDGNFGRDLWDDIVLKGKTPPKPPLTWEQAKSLWDWLDDDRCAYSPDERLLFKLAYYNANRIGASCKLRGSFLQWIDGDLWLVIPAACELPDGELEYITKMKGRKIADGSAPDHFILISGTYHEVLLKEYLEQKGLWFPAPQDKKKTRNSNNVRLSHAFNARDDNASEVRWKSHRVFTQALVDFPIPEDVPYTTPHRGRHFMATWGRVDGDIPLNVLNRMMGHIVGDETENGEPFSRTTGRFYMQRDYREHTKQGWLAWDKLFREKMGID